MLNNIINALRPNPTYVKKGEERIIGYDKDNLKEYRKYEAAEATLDRMSQKGVRQPSKKEVEKAKEIVQTYRRKKAETFLEDYKGRIKYYGMEIKASFESLPNGLIRPSLNLGDFNPFKEIENLKPWSEAMEENLATRINCHHELNEDGTVCKHCGLNPENWGSEDEGVSDEYLEKQHERITKAKEQEAKCERGEHELNGETRVWRKGRRASFRS